MIDPRHVMIRLASQADYVKALSQESHKIETSLFRLFKWTSQFDPKRDSSHAVVWVKLPQLPLPFFHIAFLNEIVGSFGHFLRADQSTITLTHPMHARVCMEVDVSNHPLPTKVWIGTGPNEGFWSPRFNH